VARAVDDDSWTLLSNTGVAVNPALTYATVDGLVIAEELGRRRVGGGAKDRIRHRVLGSALVGMHYAGPSMIWLRLVG